MTSPALKVAPTQNDPEVGLSEQQRAKLADGLSKVLGDTYTLLIKSHAVHWNVVGPLFLPVHELTEQHYNDLFAAADVIAERIRALGHITPVSFDAMIDRARLSEASSAGTTEEMIAALADDHEAMARRIRGITKEAADEHEDFVTHDLLNARMGFHEKAVWMLRAIIA